MTNRLRKLVKGMDQDTLEQLRRSVAQELNARRPAVQMEEIHPRMSAEKKDQAMQEIARVLRGEDA